MFTEGRYRVRFFFCSSSLDHCIRESEYCISIQQSLQRSIFCNFALLMLFFRLFFLKYFKVSISLSIFLNINAYHAWSHLIYLTLNVDCSDVSQDAWHKDVILSFNCKRQMHSVLQATFDKSQVEREIPSISVN